MLDFSRVAHSNSPATSPTISHNSNSPSPTPVVPTTGYNHKIIAGIPCVAAASKYTAPVHIDVGGTIYTSSLDTLTKLVDILMYYTYVCIKLRKDSHVSEQIWVNYTMKPLLIYMFTIGHTRIKHGK